MDGPGPMVPCPLCGHADCPPSPGSRSAAFRLRGCPRCENRFVWPAPSLEELRPYYRLPAYGELLYRVGADHRQRIAELSGWLGEIEAELGGPGRLLDVGASTGQLLSLALGRGWTVAGIEIDETTARQTQERLKVPVLVGAALGAIEEAPSFDLIVMSHWLEPVADPGRQLARARRRLAPNGRIWIRVPNAASRAARLLRERWTWFCPPIHLPYFAPRSFEVAAPAAGPQIRWSRAVRGDAHPLPLELLGGLLKELLARSARPDPGPWKRPPAGALLSAKLAPLRERVGWWNPFDRWEDSELQLMLAGSG